MAKYYGKAEIIKYGSYKPYIVKKIGKLKFVCSSSLTQKLV